MLFRAEWWKEDSGVDIGNVWERITANLADVDRVPTRHLMGALPWAGLLFGQPGSARGVIYADDDMPLSVGVSDDRDQIGEIVRSCRVVPAKDLDRWMRRLEGWEVEHMDPRMY